MRILTRTALLAAAALSISAGGNAMQVPAQPVARSTADSALGWGPCPPVFPGECQIAVLHGNPSQPNADILLRVAPGYVLPPHRHTSAERMILLHGRLEVKYQGAPAVVLRQGHYAYGPAGLPHRAACTSDEPCLLFIAFEGPVDAEPFAGKVD